MDYSIYKDCDVNETVERIKEILDDIGIETEEEIFEQPLKNKYKPWSTRVRMFGIDEIGTNGKGTSKENARASGYAEFMERLQNQADLIHLSNNKFVYSYDEEIVPVNKLIKFLNVFNFSNYKTILLYNKLTRNKFSFFNLNCDLKNKTILVPFYSIKFKKVISLPIFIIQIIQGSNGMCAGNTKEEALIQGLSEICERYVMKEVITKGVVMPDIPNKYYEKYEKLVGLKKSIEEIGVEIKIKDASLGKKFPVVCVIYNNKKENYFVLNFGSHPSLPIAIERCFTEFAQGKNIYKRYNCKYILNRGNNINSKQYLNSILDINYKHAYPIGYDNCFDFILNTQQKYSYNFNEENWIRKEKKYNNKYILKFLLSNIAKHFDDIYIRDNSFLGFPSFYIYIPGISVNLKKDYSHALGQHCSLNWELYTKDKVMKYESIENLIFALNFKINKDNLYFSITRNVFISYLNNEYLLLLCYIVKNDIVNILKYSKIILKNKVVKDKILIKMIFTYYKLKQESKIEKEIDEIFYKIYSKEDILKFEKFIGNLSFENIKILIAESNKKQLSKYESNYKINKEINIKMQKVKEKMIDMYIENCPNQSQLKKVLNFS